MKTFSINGPFWSSEATMSDPRDDLVNSEHCAENPEVGNAQSSAEIARTEPIRPILSGDFIEKANSGIKNASECEPVRPVLVGDFVESAAGTELEREFKVLLRDQRVLTIVGVDLKYLAEESPGGATYAVVAGSGDRERTVALFPAEEVSGIFSGEIRAAV
jgi:hypothetical protein